MGSACGDEWASVQCMCGGPSFYGAGVSLWMTASLGLRGIMEDNSAGVVWHHGRRLRWGSVASRKTASLGHAPRTGTSLRLICSLKSRRSSANLVEVAMCKVAKRHGEEEALAAISR